MINLLYLHQVLSALGSTRTPSVVPRWLQSEEPSNDGFFRPFISQSAAHTQACYSNCLLLDSCPGHTGRPYGKRENVSLKFNYLPRAYITFCCFIWVMCCEPQGASVLFPNSPAAAPLTVSARTEPRLRPRSHLLAAFLRGRETVVRYKQMSNRSNKSQGGFQNKMIMILLDPLGSQHQNLSCHYQQAQCEDLMLLCFKLFI